MHLLQLASSRTCRLNVSPAVQAKLLRAIENKKIYRLGSSRGHDLDIRILAATNQDLEEATLQNRFRGDLYYRLNVVRIEVPPLRERVEDLPALVQHYIGHFNPIFRKRVTGFSVHAMDLLFAYSWPGNVRELRNVLEASFVNLSSQSNGVVDLPAPVTRHISRSTFFSANEKTLLLVYRLSPSAGRRSLRRAVLCLQDSIFSGRYDCGDLGAQWSDLRAGG